MPSYDEEEDPYLHYRDDDSVDLEGPDESDTTPQNEYQTVNCTSCGKQIFEDLEKCPHCGHWQMEVEQLGKPRWYITTVIVCVATLVIGAATAWWIWSIL